MGFAPVTTAFRRSTSFVGQCGKGRFIIGPSRVVLPGGLAPLRRVDPRKYRISFRLDVHAGDFEARGLVDRSRIYVGAAANHNGRRAPPQCATLAYLTRGFPA